MKPFDIFLSYRSHESVTAQRLRDALAARGVRVWLDRDEIRPGDRFAEALENGMATSRAVGLIATPESIASNWVKNEYYRALSLSAAGETQLIPLVFGPAALPGFLNDRHWINFQEGPFDRNVDRLVWPGITGRQVVFVSIAPGHAFPWNDLGERLSRLGCRVLGGEDIHRAPGRIRSYMSGRATRIVGVVDIFEGWPNPRIRRNTPSEYVEFIFQTRRETKGTPDEIVFLLHHHSMALKQVDHGLTPEQQDRIAHYFTVHSDHGPDHDEGELESMWLRIQNELLQTDVQRR